MDVPSWEIRVNLQTSDIGVFACPIGEVDEASCRDLVDRERRAPVGKGQRNPARTTETIPNLHDWHSPNDASSPIGDSENERRVAVAFRENSSPRWMMERECLRMVQDELEPAFVLWRKNQKCLASVGRLRRRRHD